MINGIQNTKANDYQVAVKMAKTHSKEQLETMYKEAQKGQQGAQGGQGGPGQGQAVLVDLVDLVEVPVVLEDLAADPVDLEVQVEQVKQTTQKNQVKQKQVESRKLLNRLLK
ncbi:MAG TPA: hypothetical protein PL076_08960 [Bacillota bacterium]|nr:hypothetical protein [Bacillota bacterium]